MLRCDDEYGTSECCFSKMSTPSNQPANNSTRKDDFRWLSLRCAASTSTAASPAPSRGTSASGLAAIVTNMTIVTIMILLLLLMIIMLLLLLLLLLLLVLLIIVITIMIILSTCSNNTFSPCDQVGDRNSELHE